MPRISVAFGAVLFLVGLVFFLKTGLHFTALIPSFIGFILIICGLVGAQELRRKHAMHAAAVAALLGFLGCVGGFPKVARHLLGAAIDKPAAQYEKVLAALICAIFLALCIRSFREARRQAPKRK